MDMPRTIKTEDFDVYRLDELEPHAREKAIARVAELLGGDWWDENNIEDVSSVIKAKLGEKLGTPEWETTAICEFEIPGVKLNGWDLDRGSYLALRGRLTPDNAPALPWTDGVASVELDDHRDYTRITVEFDEDLAAPDVELIEGQMEEAVQDAIGEAMKAGREQMEYISSEENALEDIEANEREFYADGSLYA